MKAAGWVKGKAKAGVAHAKGRGARLGGTRMEQTPSSASREASADVHKHVESDLQSNFNSGIRSAAAARSVMAKVFAEYQPKGLKRLSTRPIVGQIGAFQVMAEASPETPVMRKALLRLGIELKDLDFREGTFGRAIVNRAPRDMQTSTGPTHHAESKILKDLEDHWDQLAPSKKRPVFLLLQVSRSPCGPSYQDCKGEIDRFLRSKRAEGYDIHFGLDIGSLYEGKQSRTVGASQIQLQELKDVAGNHVGVWDILRTIEQHMDRPMQEGDLPPETVRKLKMKAEQVSRELELLAEIAYP
jgi:hypothetical protein